MTASSKKSKIANRIKKEVATEKASFKKDCITPNIMKGAAISGELDHGDTDCLGS